MDPHSSRTERPAAWSRLATQDVHSLAFVGDDPNHLLFGQPARLDIHGFAPGPAHGEEITFVFKNEGIIVPEFVVGTDDEQVDHAAAMAAGGMSHGHNNALSLINGARLAR